MESGMTMYYWNLVWIGLMTMETLMTMESGMTMVWLCITTMYDYGTNKKNVKRKYTDKQLFFINIVHERIRTESVLSAVESIVPQ